MATAAPGAPRGIIDFGRSFTFVSEDPEWVKKILIGGVFTLACACSWACRSCSATSRARSATWSRASRGRLPEWDDLGGLFDEGLRLTAVYLSTCSASSSCSRVFAASCSCPCSCSGRGEDPSEALGPLGALGIVGALRRCDARLAGARPSTCRRRSRARRCAAPWRDGFAWRENLGFIKANLANYALSLVDLPARGLPRAVRACCCAAWASSRRRSGATWCWRRRSARPSASARGRSTSTSASVLAPPAALRAARRIAARARPSPAPAARRASRASSARRAPAAARAGCARAGARA